MPHASVSQLLRNDSHNLYSRGGHEIPENMAAKVRAAGGNADDQIIGDIKGSMMGLRSLLCFNCKVGLFGTCSGWCNTFLTVCRTKGFNAAVESR